MDVAAKGPNDPTHLCMLGEMSINHSFRSFYLSEILIQSRNVVRVQQLFFIVLGPLMPTGKEPFVLMAAAKSGKATH